MGVVFALLLIGFVALRITVIAWPPQRQLAFSRIIHELVEEENCQFIIASHSPILLGYPGASILSFDEGEIHSIDYEQTHHYQVTKYFLDHREKFLKELFEDG